jgi:hypothetical protein
MQSEVSEVEDVRDKVLTTWTIDCTGDKVTILRRVEKCLIYLPLVALKTVLQEPM